MLYVKWRINFKGLPNEDYRIDIYKEPGAAQQFVTTLYGAAEPFSTQEDATDDVFTPIRKQTGYIRIVTTNKDLVKEMMPSAPFDRLVRVWKGSTNPVCVWQGYLKQQVFTQPIGDYRWQIEFPVISMLGMLQYSYPNMAGQTWVSIASVIENGLNAISTDIDEWPVAPYDTIEYDNMYTGAKVFLNSVQSVQIPTSEIPIPYSRWACNWQQLAIRFNELFFSQRTKIDGDMQVEYTESESYYSIISKLLRPFAVVMREEGRNIYMHIYQMHLQYNAIEVDESTLDYRSNKREVSLILPAQTCSVNFNIKKDDVVLKLMQIPIAQMNNDPIYVNDSDPNMVEKTQFHDPGNYEHHDEEFHFFHNTSESYPPIAANYVESDYETFVNLQVLRSVPGKYNPLGACPVLTNLNSEDDKLYPALLIQSLWTSQVNRKIVYTKKTTVQMNAAEEFYHGIINLETIDEGNWIVGVAIENNGQYYNDGTWQDNIAWTFITVHDGKTVPNRPDLTTDGHIIFMTDRSGEFKIHFGSIHPDASSYGDFNYMVYFTKIDLTLYNPNLNNLSVLNGEGDDRSNNEYYTGTNYTENAQSVQTYIGTCNGNAISPSLIYVPKLSYASGKYSQCMVMMSLYKNTPGSEAYFEAVPELLLLSMMKAQNETKRETRTMTVVPFISRTAVYKIGTKYFIAIEAKRNWCDNTQKVKFIEIAPIRG